VSLFSLIDVDFRFFLTQDRVYIQGSLKTYKLRPQSIIAAKYWFTARVGISNSSSFEPDVVCSVSVIPLQHRSCSLHTFCQDGPPQRIDCLAPRWEITLSVRYCIGNRTKVSQPFDYQPVASTN